MGERWGVLPAKSGGGRDGALSPLGRRYFLLCLLFCFWGRDRFTVSRQRILSPTLKLTSDRIDQTFQFCIAEILELEDMHLAELGGAEGEDVHIFLA